MSLERIKQLYMCAGQIRSFTRGTSVHCFGMHTIEDRNIQTCPLISELRKESKTNISLACQSDIHTL